jgi:arylsulfatase A-like enzyme
MPHRPGRPSPNILFILTDDHAAQAIGAYGSRVNVTPNIDRIANDGTRLDRCYATNSLCAPSRASILTGTYSHINNVQGLQTPFDNSQETFAHRLRGVGYETALFGKWHLGHGEAHDPRGFDDWCVFPGQGEYHDPLMLGPDGEHQQTGYATDIVTDMSLDWLARRDIDKPFCLLTWHKAPHRPWEPDDAHADLYPDATIPLPDTLFDDYAGRGPHAPAARMRISEDLTRGDVKADPPDGLTGNDLTTWYYRRYLSDYLRCVASVDDNVGRMLDWLDANDLADDTVVIYSSDQGFFLGEHGWYDKRFIYEESMRMPFCVRWPGVILPGTVSTSLCTNVDLAATFCDIAGVEPGELNQGESMLDVWRGQPHAHWRDAFYYRYFEHNDGAHGVWAHYGIRTDRYKLVIFYNDGLGLPGTGPRTDPPYTELYDLETDPQELRSVADDPAYAHVRADLEARLAGLQAELRDVPYSPATA